MNTANPADPLARSTEPPVTPATKRSEADRRAHVVQFYKEDAGLLDALGGFVGAALGAGEAAIVIATEAHRDGLEERLRARGMDTGWAREQGRYMVVDAEETLAAFMVNGRPDATRFHDVLGGMVERATLKSERGHPCVAVFGEMVTVLWVRGEVEAAVALEGLWNDLARNHTFSLRCAYPLNSFRRAEDGEPFLKICAEHSGVIPGETYTMVASEEERLRSIAHLQQQAQAFESERALRHSEEKFRLLVESVQDYAIFMLDPEGRISTWNAGAERIKGYKASEIIGKHFSCFYPEDDLRAGKPQWELKVATEQGRFEDEGWRLRNDGSRFWANVVITALRDNTGRLCGFSKVTRDNTERMRVYEALRSTNEELRKEIAERLIAEKRLHDSEQSLRRLSGRLLQMQDEERRRFARELHDGSAQLVTALSLNLGLVNQSADRLDERARQALTECFSLVDECSRELRTFSYLMHPPVLEGQGLGSAIKWFVEGFAQRSGVAIHLEIPPACERLTPDAEIAMFRVVQECLTNVHRHSQSSTATVRVTHAPDELILEVKDSGRGVPQEALESLQSGGSTLGVGLRGMQERLWQFGGRIEIESAEGLGTTVRAVLPLRASNGTVSGQSSSPSERDTE